MRIVSSDHRVDDVPGYGYTFLVKRRDLEKELRRLGFEVLREGGDHTVFAKDEVRISVPRHKEINEYTAKAILKKARAATR